jgi:hypothetical protein
MMGENAERVGKMKKIALVLAFFLLFSGVVTASSINGDYKGNSIVKVISGGKVLESDEVPGMIYDGHTLVPISMLRQIGASVTWNAETYSVNVEMPKDPLSFNIASISKEMKAYAVNSVSYNSDGTSNVITYNYGAIIDNITNDQFNKIIFSSAATDANTTIISDTIGNTFSVPTQSVRLFAMGKITADELSKQYTITKSNNSSNSLPNVQPVPQQNQQSNVTLGGPEFCKSLLDQYALDKGSLEAGLDPFSGSSVTKRQEFETAWNTKLSFYGCKKP